MANSFTLKKVDNDRVFCYFDREKIVGKMRKGRIVKDYYPVYVLEQAKHFNFLAVMMYHFYKTLYAEVRKLMKIKKVTIEEIMITNRGKDFYNRVKQEYALMIQQRKEKIKEEKTIKRLKLAAIRLEKDKLDRGQRDLTEEEA